MDTSSYLRIRVDEAHSLYGTGRNKVVQRDREMHGSAGRSIFPGTSSSGRRGFKNEDVYLVLTPSVRWPVCVPLSSHCNDQLIITVAKLR